MPKPTRFPFGLALGFENQFNNYGKGGSNAQGALPAGTQYEQVTAGLLAQASTAPDISFGSLFYTNNTTNTVINDFKQTWTGRASSLTAGGQTDTSGPPPEGKLITVIFLDNSTQLVNAGNLILNGTDNLLGINHSITLLGSNGKWYEIARSKNNTSEVSSFTIGSAASINVNDLRVATVIGTAATSIVRSFSGGQVGQVVYLMSAGSSGVNHFVDTGGNITLITTNMYAINASGVYEFVKRNNTTWSMVHIGSTGIANV